MFPQENQQCDQHTWLCLCLALKRKWEMLCAPKILDTVSPYRSFMIGSWWHQTFFLITLTTVLFPTIPFHLFDPFHPLPTPLPSPTLSRRWKELHQTNSCSRTKCPSTTLNSPGYLKPLPPASLVPLNSIFVQLLLFPLSLVIVIVISLHQCLLSLIAGVSSLTGFFSHLPPISS